MAFLLDTKMRKFGSLLFFSLLPLLVANKVSAQQHIFDLNVDVNYAQISSSSGIDYLDELEGLIRDYILDNRWTEKRYQENERIRLNIVVNLNSAEGTNVSATFLVSLERPIFNTMQYTSLMVISDNTWQFDFRPNRNLLHDEFQYDDIASMLDYYTYLALGIDGDSFSELGGEEYYRKARNIVETAQASGATGWGSTGGSRRNRHFLISHFLNPSYEDLRKGIYQYHRHGLDLFTTSVDQARENALEALQKVRNAQRQTTDSYPFDLLFSTKYREFTAFFLEAEPDQRLEAYNLLLQMDRSHISEYDKLQ